VYVEFYYVEKLYNGRVFEFVVWRRSLGGNVRISPMEQTQGGSRTDTGLHRRRGERRAHGRGGPGSDRRSEGSSTRDPVVSEAMTSSWWYRVFFSKGLIKAREQLNVQNAELRRATKELDDAVVGKLRILGNHAGKKSIEL